MVKTRFRTGILLALGGLVAGYILLWWPAATASIRSVETPAVPSSTATLAPAPAADQVPQAPASPPPLESLNANLQAYISEQPGDWSYYLIDLTTAQTIGQGAQVMHPAASTIKLPLALYIYDEVVQGRASLDEKLTYLESDWEDGAGSLLWELTPGDTMTVGELVEIMVRQSDNVAKNMLMRRFNRDGLFAWIRAQGGEVELRDDGDGGLIYTNAETLASMMRLLYQNQAFRNGSLRETLLTYLESTDFADRSEAGVPDGVRVAHKIGNLPDVVNDVGLILAPHGPYILVALSEGVSDEGGADTIAALTQMSYQYLEEHHQKP
jgi:beta-lactamase class A